MLLFIVIYLYGLNQYSINKILAFQFLTFLLYCLLANILSKRNDSTNMNRDTFQKIDKLKRIKKVD